MRYKFLDYSLVILLIIGFGCGKLQEGSKVSDENNYNTINNKAGSLQEGVSDKDIVLNKAKKIIQLLEEKNFENLAKYIHPGNGLRFSPYAFVDKEQDQVFPPSEIRHLKNKGKVYNWGFYDGSGKPIEGTFEEYYQQFIYDKDFADSAKIIIDQDHQRGNSINNSREAYGQESHIVEFYVPGQEEKYGGMDWKSLRLVFSKYNGKWYLEGIIHSQWTI